MVISAMVLNGISKMANEQNLKPWKPGQSGNPKGRPKGIRNFSTIIQQLLADEELMDKISKNKPSYWDHLPIKNGANALVTVMLIKALQGDVKAASWLTKNGYGDKLTHQFEEGLFQANRLEVEIVKPKIVDERDSES